MPLFGTVGSRASQGRLMQQYFSPERRSVGSSVVDERSSLFAY